MTAREALAAVAAPLAAPLAAACVFVLVLLLLGHAPARLPEILWRGGFADAFAWRNTVQRAAPLMLTALAVAIPARLGLLVIGGEGALALGGLAATMCALALPGAWPVFVLPVMALAGMFAGGAWVGVTGALRGYRGVNETLVSLVSSYIAIALFDALIEGPWRDPASLNKPATRAIDETYMLGGDGWHPGLLAGVLACLLSWVVLRYGTLGFTARIVAGNLRAARLLGLPVARLMTGACALGGACAGLAGMLQVAAIHGRASASLLAGQGFAGVLVSFLARHDPLAIAPVAILVGGIGAAGGLMQRRLGVPDAAASLFEGLVFVAVLSHGTSRGRLAR